jgi:signal transduction histidine kinase
VAGALLMLAAGAGAVAGLAVRWRRGGPLVRRQLLLLVLAACPPASVGVAVVVSDAVPGWLFTAALVPLPVAIAVATLSYGLYDLRRAANRALVWVFMSGGLAGIYAAVVFTATALAPDRTLWWPPAVAAAVAALALIPMRPALQRAVNHVIYGRWRQPYQVLAGLGEDLEAAADVDRLLQATVSELATGLGLGAVAPCDPDGAPVAGHRPSPLGPGGRSELRLHAYGSTVGWLEYQPPVAGLTGTAERLLRDLARHLGGAMHARMLRADLQRARETLVLAREEERRRLRRDLHDGIGPALAGLTLKAETAQALLPTAAVAAEGQLGELVEQIRGVVLDVRRLVEGLRPPALDELGLVGACTQATQRLAAAAGLPLSMDAADLPALPAATEVAAYRIVVEAVTNVARHSGARACQVSMSVTGPGLILSVVDDGHGLPGTPSPGNGMAIMRERAEELGGHLIVAPATPGLRVEARLPA